MRQYAVTEIQYGMNSYLAAVLCVDGRIEELELEKKEKASETGIVYCGITESVNKSVGGGFLRAGKKGPYYLPRRKHEKLRVSAPILFQVTKDASGHKGAEVTENIELAGSYLVLSRFPGPLSFSRKLNEEQKKLILKWLPAEAPCPYRILIRTNAKRAEKAELLEELERLRVEMDSILERFPKAANGEIIYRPEEFWKRMYRNFYETPDCCISDIPKVREALDGQENGLSISIEEQFGIKAELDRLLGKYISLKNGAYLVLEKTEAFVSIDVNSGTCKKGKSPENAFYMINIDAADEIARQLRLRNLGGMILIDFISMEDEQHKKDLLTHMRKALRKDHQIAEAIDITPLGIMELTREQGKKSLQEEIGTLYPEDTPHE